MDEFLPIKSFRVKNFKGIRDSGEVRFTPLTVFIGNNGSGKSSLIEALQTYQDIARNSLHNAMNRWRGFENIHNPPISLTGENGNKPKSQMISFIVEGYDKITDTNYSDEYASKLSITIGFAPQNHNLEILKEEINFNNKLFIRRDNNEVLYNDKKMDEILPSYSITSQAFVVGLTRILHGNSDYTTTSNMSRLADKMLKINHWQFVTLNPFNMIHPLPLGYTNRLNSDGSNIAEYLMDIRKQSPEAFEGIIEALTYVLPYLADLQPYITSELERTVYLRMHEGTYTIPQWLLSTGTMRILCLLALFRHPTPPPVIFIEEIENGLDPRTIHFVVEEIRNLVTTGTSQVIVTTHSPYFLDLLDLSQIVVVERENGETTFSRPADDESLQIWAKKFSPGSLYTMSKLTRG